MKKRSIGGQDFVRDHSQVFNDSHEEMEYIVIELLAQAIFKMGKRSLAWNMDIFDSGI